MKRRLMIVENTRFMMKDIFGINDKEVDQVIKFMEEDYEHILDAIKMAIISGKLSDRQKMLVSYIVGDSSGTRHARELDDLARKDYNMSDVGMYT
jgi:hypothetical protein